MLKRAVGQQPAARATVPRSLLVHLHELVPGFAAEEPRDQWSLAVMLWACAEGGRPHKRWPDMFSFSMKDIREMWGEDVRMHRVVGSRYFTAHQGNNLTEVTNGYAPSIEMAEALVRTINSKVDELVDAHSLQSMPGMVRSAALAGAWDYDISTAHWTILSQMASRLDVDCPRTSAYIADKRSTRRAVSSGAGLSLDDAKKCITALLYGAVVQRSKKAMRWHPGALVEAVGEPAALRLSEQPDFMAMYAEIGRVGEAVVKAWPRQNGRLFNDLRIQHQSGSELAHLLQGAEALRAVVMPQRGNILLCVHDGWVAQERLDVDALVDHIETETGYRVGIEEARLEAPGRDRIKRKLDEFEAFSEGELQFVCPFAVAQGEWSPLDDPEESRTDRPGASRPRFTPSDEAGLWTSHPHPAEPVAATRRAALSRSVASLASESWTSCGGASASSLSPHAVSRSIAIGTASTRSERRIAPRQLMRWSGPLLPCRSKAGSFRRSRLT